MSEPYATKMAIVIRRDLRNSQGNKVRSTKLMAQTGHAGMKWINSLLQGVKPEPMGGYILRLSAAEHAWLTGPTYTKVVLGVDNLDELMKLVHKADGLFIGGEIIKDFGLTEFSEPTITACAIGPATNDLVDRITGHLKPF